MEFTTAYFIHNHNSDKLNYVPTMEAWAKFQGKLFAEHIYNRPGFPP